MDDLTNDSSSANGGADRQKKGRWKRAQQVCTNCRQMKLRCDFQERFPEPCTRCASSGHARGMPCHVDPLFRRVTKRGSDGPSPQSTTGQDESPSAGPSEPRLFAERLPHTELILPAPDLTAGGGSSSSSPSDACDQPSHTLDSITLSGEDIAGLFHEYFTYYHPFLQLILEPVGPEETFAQSRYLFWAICSVACHPRHDHPVHRARTSDLCVELGKEVKILFSNMLLERCRDYRLVQALILVCEYPYVMPQGKEDFIWLYSGLAITIGTQIGLHRPKFAEEYSSIEENPKGIERLEMRERILTWIQCFNVHQSLASFRGYPGLMADDWVLVKGASKPVEFLCSRIFDIPDVFRTLRIYRLVRRLSLAVGNDPHTASGQVSRETRGPLLAVFAAELADLEAALKPLGGVYGDRCRSEATLAPAVAVRLLEAKLQLYTFELQDEAAGASPEDLLICYTSSVRIVGMMAALHKEPATRAVYWPRSIYGSFVAAVLCLLKLAGIQVMAPRRLQIDRSVILKEIAVAYDIMKARSLVPGDISDRRALAIRFLASRLQAGSLPATPTAGVSVRSRMSLGGLLYDSIRHIKAVHDAEVRAAAKAHDDGKQAPVQVGDVCAAEVIRSLRPPSPATAAIAAPRQEPAATVQPAPVDLSAFGPGPNGWDASTFDMSSVPPLDSAEWLQMLSAESCAEIMSMPGYDPSTMAAWDIDVAMMDPFTLGASFSI